MIGKIVYMRDMIMKQKIDKNSKEAPKEAQIEKSLESNSDEQQRLKLEEETKAIHKQAELLLEDEANRKKASQDKTTLSGEKISDKKEKTTTDKDTVLNKDNSMQNNTKDNSPEKTAVSPRNDESQIKSLKFKVNALAAILVLTIAGGVYGAYQFDKHKYDDLEVITNNLKTTEQNILNTQNKINAVYTDILEKDKRADILFSQNADLRSQNNVLKNNEEALQEKIDAAVLNTEKINIRLNNYEDRNPYDWFIAQSYFLVSNAQNILSFSDNVQSALLNLKQADLLLVKLDDPKVKAIREAIIQDTIALQNLPTIDTTGIFLKLDSIYNNTDNMPLNEFLSGNSKDAFKKVNEPSDQVKDWKQNLCTSVKEFSSRFIEVRRREDSVVNQFLSPDQTKILLKNIKTELLLSKVAVFNHDEDSFNHNIKQIQDHIRSYFDVNNEVVQNNLKSLDELAELKIKLDKPKQLSSIKLFNSLAQEKFNLYETQKKQLKEGKND